MNDYTYYPQNALQPDYLQQSEAPVMTVWNWIVVMIIISLPVANVIMLFVWAFDSTGNPNRSNFAKAALIFVAFQLVLASLFMGAILGSISSIFNTL